METVSREARIGAKKEGLFKLYLNEYEDFIYLNESDASIFDRFAEFLRWLDQHSEEITGKEAALREKYGDKIITYDEDGDVTDVNTAALLEMSKLRTDTFRETRERLDNIFGAGTIRKYFRAFYEANPDFVPDDECYYDFLEEITPVLNSLFSGRKERLSLKYNKNRRGGKNTPYRSKGQLIADDRK